MPPDPGNRNGRAHRCLNCPRDAHVHEPAEDVARWSDDREAGQQAQLEDPDDEK